MITAIYFIFAFMVGLAAGVVYFGGLWLTLLRLQTLKRPMLFTMLSFLLRLVSILLIFYLVIRFGNWKYLIASLIGFIAVKFYLIRRLKPLPKEEKLKEKIEE